MKLKITQTSQTAAPSIVYANGQQILQLVITEVVKYVTVYM